MWPKKTIALCLLGGSALSVIAMSCADHLTGQIPEPEGPLLVTKLTLLDKRLSRDVAVFTDTSLPDCSSPPSSVPSRQTAPPPAVGFATTTC